MFQNYHHSAGWPFLPYEILSSESPKGKESSLCSRQKAASGLQSHTGQTVFYIVRQTAVTHICGKATADVSWHGVMFTYHGVMSLFHVENEAMSRATRVTLLVLSWNHRISELESFLTIKNKLSSNPGIKLKWAVAILLGSEHRTLKGILKYHNMSVTEELASWDIWKKVQ